MKRFLQLFLLISLTSCARSCTPAQDQFFFEACSKACNNKVSYANVEEGSCRCTVDPAKPAKLLVK